MKSQELIKLLVEFLNQYGQYNNFIEFAYEQGYGDEEIDDAIINHS